MKIVCTVKEFGEIVRGCERGECWKCPLSGVCEGKEKGVEQFVSYVVSDENHDTRRSSDG